MEIKRTTVPKLSRGFHIAAAGMKASRKIPVYAGAREVPAGGGTRALRLAAAIDLLRGR